jgi:flagellar hook assembly protein FlgD
LYANYPNPFNPTTTLKYDLAKSSHVSLVIYNMLGQKIRTLVDAVKPAGYHAAVWDGANDSGAAIASGIYFFEFKADGYAQTNKMILMK